MFLKVFKWNLCKCNCWLIIEVILRNARCNSKVYIKTQLKVSIENEKIQVVRSNQCMDNSSGSLNDRL